LTSPLDDARLLKRIGAGDRAAMKLLYERHSEALYHFIRVRLRDPFEAADVMQEVFLEIWRAAGRFEARSTARTWIFGIGRNKTLDRMRRGARVVLAEPDVTLPDEAPNPEAVAEAASDAARVRDCIGRLSDTHRSAIHLAFYRELPYSDIAEIEGVPVGTIKTRILHAKRLLMHCLAGFRIA
jgi:RNA polymerase sigma-70 factor (ECF subfamily)